MGANSSRGDENGGATTNTYTNDVFSNTYHSNHNPVISMQSPAASNYSSNNYKVNKSSFHTASAAALLPSSRFGLKSSYINFHSSPTCRAYLEAGKACNTLMVIAFTNGWCEGCRSMEPTLHEFAAKYSGVEFLKIDVDELYNISQEYRIETTPTFLLMKRGKLVAKVTGPMKKELQTTIENIEFKS